MQKIKQITDPDMRFYEVEPGVFYPSMTTILGKGTPTQDYLIKWWKQNGFMSDHLMYKAASEGTIVHNAIENFLLGEELQIEEYSNNIFLWEMICRFAQFFHLHVDEVFLIEVMTFSHKLRTAGTTDLVARLKDGFIWVIDYKTSNYASDSFGIQTMGYKVMLEETAGIKIDKRGALHLKAKTRGPSKKAGKFQGKGWNLIEYTDDEGDYKKLVNARRTYELYHPNAKPNLRKYPTVLSMFDPFNPDDFTFTLTDEDGEEDN